MTASLMSTLPLKASEGSNGNYTHCWLQSRRQAAHSKEVGQIKSGENLVWLFPMIFSRHLLPRQRLQHGLAEEDVEVGEEVMKEVVQGYTQEAGVRWNYYLHVALGKGSKRTYIIHYILLSVSFNLII